ncbi:MAG: ubiquinone/menaquinone biosynthesis methyltransferase [Acidobacteriota bacterium]|nr:ubiquinone/menaquinone biosynthesis methyltransferase [Acidobacteriota bacterium]
MAKGLREIFFEIAPAYERVNRVLTLGLDRGWREAAARTAAGAGGSRWLDVCSGTGDMARALAARAPAGTSLSALDFCPPMLRRAAARDAAHRISFVLGNAASLPFPDASFDLLTVSFATRNLNLFPGALRETCGEFRRVLRPGGVYVNVETSRPPAAIVRLAFRVYVRLFVRPLGRLFSGADAGYAYLAASIPRFYSAEELAGILKEAGFSKVTFRRLLLGAAAVHRSVR